MAGDSDIIGQAEIEALLRQARGAAQPSPSAPSTPAPSAAADPGTIAQDEIDMLLSGGGRKSATATATAVAPKPPATATATATSPRPATGPRTTGDDIQFLLEQAEAAIASINQPNPTPASLTPFTLTDLASAPASQEKATLDLLRDVELDLKIELGRTNMYLEDVLKLKRGSVVTLDKLAGDPVDIYANGRLIARGEVLVLNDNFCVRVAELVSGDDMK